MNCPKCNEEMIRRGKKTYFWTMFFISLIIWPCVLLLPFMFFLPPLQTCRKCKKSYKEKDLLKVNV